MSNLGSNLAALFLIWVVMDSCHDKRSCGMTANLAAFGAQDPCPNTTKYLDVAYKCRPSEFRSRVVCEDEDMLLQCKKARRIVIYSATFGHSHKAPLKCSAQPIYDAECLSPCPLDDVMRLCHGRRRCTIPVNERTFESTCRPGVPKYLEVVYACVAKRILKELKEGQEFPVTRCGQADEIESPRLNDTDAALPIRPSTIINLLTPTPDTPAGEPETSAVQEQYIGFLSDWFRIWAFLKDNKEKVVLYAVMGLLVGIICLLLTIICRMWLSKRHHKKTAKLDISEPVPTSHGVMTQRPEDMTLLSDHGHDRHDGVEMLSFQNQGTFHRGSVPATIPHVENNGPPPPSATTSGYTPPYTPYKTVSTARPQTPVIPTQTPTVPHSSTHPQSSTLPGYSSSKTLPGHSTPVHRPPQTPVPPPQTPIAGVPHNSRQRTNSLPYDNNHFDEVPVATGLDFTDLNDVNDNHYERNTGTLGSRSFDNYYR